MFVWGTLICHNRNLLLNRILQTLSNKIIMKYKISGQTPIILQYNYQ